MEFRYGTLCNHCCYRNIFFDYHGKAGKTIIKALDANYVVRDMGGAMGTSMVRYGRGYQNPAIDKILALPVQFDQIRNIDFQHFQAGLDSHQVSG